MRFVPRLACTWYPDASDKPKNDAKLSVDVERRTAAARVATASLERHLAMQLNVLFPAAGERPGAAYLLPRLL